MMVKDKVDFDVRKLDDIRDDVVHFERLIGDLVGVLSKSISFCIHSGDSINSLLIHYLGNNVSSNMENDCDPKENIQEPSCINNNNIDTNDMDYIQFSSNGVLYSLPKKVTNSLIGSYLYEQSQEDQRTVEGHIYLDYPYNDACAPYLIDSLMNKKINVEQLNMKDQIDLLRLFEFCELPIPVELSKGLIVRNCEMRIYKEDDDIKLYINGKKDISLKNYWKRKGRWNQVVREYCYGYVDYYEQEKQLVIKMEYEYIEYIYQYVRCNCIYISPEKKDLINKELLRKEIYKLFGDEALAMTFDCDVNKTFNQSTIINQELATSLMNWLGTRKMWRLLFRASDHNYSAKEFHKYCDNRGETVTLIKHIGHDDHINIFGGYTDQNWESKSDTWKPHSSEFIFTLSNEHDVSPTKYSYSLHYEKFAMYCDSTSGPRFGNDIDICDNCHYNRSSCNSRNYNEYNTPQKNSLFVNTNEADETNYFIVDDYEVWGRA
ncbi:hypothetical protein WA158_004011 [Blastocystis sp. Blastoise]